jgi:membrane-bound lytic murein transglycosylase A
MRRGFLSFVIVLTLWTAAGCHQPVPNYSAQLPPGTLALRKIPPEMYPSFATAPADMARIHPAIQFSLEYLSKPSSQSFYPYADISHDRAVATLHALDDLAQAAAAGQISAQDIDTRIRSDFEVYQSVGAPVPDGSGYTGKVLFTGYFTPIYNASLTRGGPYQWPLYKRPADLVSDPVTGEVHGRRTPDGQIVPYYTRAQIEAGALAGQELCWLTSRFEAYVVTVQGSGRLRLPNGSIYEVGFNGFNGYPYVSIGQQMVADGLIPSDHLNLSTMRQYFDAHPDALDKYLPANQRTVFFAHRPGGPYGKLNEPVTPLATIATDKEDRDIYPRAMSAFLVVPLPSPGGGSEPFRGFMLDQDTGGAIRASGRCDIFMGVGESAEELAGREFTEGQLYYVAIKPDLVQKYLANGR